MPPPAFYQRGLRSNPGEQRLAAYIAAVMFVAASLVYMTFNRDHHYSHNVDWVIDEEEGHSGAKRGSTNGKASFPRDVRGQDGGLTERDLTNPLAVPPGKARNLPSIRVEQDPDDNADQHRAIYGGKGDKSHLGGFTKLDPHGISPSLWKYMVEKLNIKSVMDVGCGKGVSTTWFYLHGLDVLCVEGSHDAVQQSLLPDPENQVVEHDFSRGPYWPEKTYDAVWAVEFLEHVPIQYHFNYISTFRKAVVLFVTSSRWGGWHHVEVHPDAWWIRKYEAYGFRYDANLTQTVREIARAEKNKGNGPNDQRLNPQHIYLSMKVFVNPVVASLPQHAHVFAAEFGCYQGKDGNGAIINRECGTGKDAHLETKLPPEFYPLKLTPEQDEAWDNVVRKHINNPKKKPKNKSSAAGK